MFTNAFIVLCLRQYLVVLAVGEHEDGALNAAEELLYHNTARRIAKHTSQHFLQFFLRLFECWQYEHTFAGTQSVCFKHVGGFECFQEPQAFLHMFAIECLIACSGDVVAFHESFGKVFRTLQHSTGLRGANDGHSLGALVVFHVVVNAFHQRVFGSHDNHVDAVVGDELLDSLEVVSFHVDVLCLGQCACAGIARSNKQFFHSLALSRFPCQCVLTAATA